MHGIEEADVVSLTPRQRLPFTIRIARSEQQLAGAVRIRHAAYARHVPALAERLSEPEPRDRETDATVLLAESRLDGTPLGTMRIERNRDRPLAIEQSVALPAALRRRSLAEATRLGVCTGRMGHMVKVMLFKAFYHFCRQASVDWMVIGARSPLDRQYESLLFRDVFPGRGFVPLAHAAGLPHRILGFELETAEARWLHARHPLYGLFCRTEHPDIDLRSAEAMPASEAVA
ncbi:MAG TPA: hypothetical protein VE935_11190 [Burkholderiales bacterium]|nr:hypothetical protein [Burkholderiales bacterium]